MKSRIVCAASALTLSVLLLTGCSAAHSAADPFSAQSPATVGKSAAPTATPTPTYTPGQKLSEYHVLPDGLFAYKMSDGTYVVVSGSAPVPAAVVADAGKQAKAKILPVTDTSAYGQQAVLQQASGVASEVAAETGHTAVVVYRGTAVSGVGSSDPRVVLVWKVYVSDDSLQALTVGNGSGWPTAAAALSAAQQAVGSDPSTVIVVAR